MVFIGVTDIARSLKEPGFFVAMYWDIAQGLEQVPYTHEVVSSNLTIPIELKWTSSTRGVCAALKKRRKWFNSTLVHKEIY
jgi:hypothetical protein